jgi:hypothetical protein
LILLLAAVGAKVFCERDTPVRGLWEIAIVRKAAVELAAPGSFFGGEGCGRAEVRGDAAAGGHSRGTFHHEFSEALIPDPI